MIRLLREGVNNWVSERIFERRIEWTSQWVTDEMREQSNEQADVCNYPSEWENTENDHHFNVR